ncbi:MAG TPA: tetratricopeptide repeat protein [Verrucomicrobiae bacterium]|nr:tetratricopeptide repeat protein [Verrucomicrobiae bacterium]
MDLFPPSNARILEFVNHGLSPFERALLSDERGDTCAAELYAEAINEQDCVADSFCNLGIIESQKGNATRAFDCFTTCLKHDPRHSEAHYNLGNLYFELNDFRLAQIHFEMAVEVDRDFANAYFNLALVQSINNDPDAAVRTLGKYRDLASEEDGRMAEELLETVKKSLAIAKTARRGSL